LISENLDMALVFEAALATVPNDAADAASAALKKTGGVRRDH
jgi:hypothetical protein